ncbi:hypothetical protein BDN72DRAFT_653317 [Pluteus cervinus]|uniref:Uncharacterized protein n=1 Tax=Pluteus cervinus TaxID=181527 RepID=A0ACD3ASN8_9AGAR|nr:hypothetical protein BDN72DRAFT_653317 [Pluteus cervinus]
MKGCLKMSSRSSSPGLECPHHPRKCVAFGADGSEVVYVADEWDRTPAEPARHLSYQDLLELKEIQRSLPLANQPSDPMTGKPASHYCSAVPIGLLPLCSESNPAPMNASSNTSSPSPSPTSSIPNSPTHWASSFKARDAVIAPQPRQLQPWHPPHFTQSLPGKPTSQPQKPKFSFLPLLDTPPTSATNSPFTSNPSSRTPSPDHLADPPTPTLTNASLDSSPHSHPSSSSSPEPPFFQLPPPKKRDESHHFGPDDSCNPHHLPQRSSGFQHDALYPGLPAAFSNMRFQPVGHGQNGSVQASSQRSSSNQTLKPPPTKRRKNIIVINDMEIEVDDDDDEDEYVDCRTATPVVSTTPVPCQSPVSTTDSKTKHPPSPPRTPSPQYSWRSSTPQLPSSPPRTNGYVCEATSLGSPIRFKRGTVAS